eukprot:XP_001709046.1 Hypothetical protein GL50803_113114 [Giardia lamblia ATCC 50803]
MVPAICPVMHKGEASANSHAADVADENTVCFSLDTQSLAGISIIMAGSKRAL